MFSFYQTALCADNIFYISIKIYIIIFKEFEKLSSKKLKINAKEAMKIAEKLYTRGFISYPRTETNIFPKDFNLRYFLLVI